MDLEKIIKPIQLLKTMKLSDYQQDDENLIPFYIIEDKVKQNVHKNNAFMADCIKQQ